jgi:hypothetical protein
MGLDTKTDRPTGRLTVGRNINLTLTLTLTIFILRLRGRRRRRRRRRRRPAALLSQSAYIERQNHPPVEEETPLPSSDKGDTDRKEIT